MILGDLGADIIKVERPLVGDESRGWGPPFNADGQSAYFLSINRNKLGIALDLDSDADRRQLTDLIAGADVVLENFRRGTLERRGLSALDLLQRQDRLIWCTISGFGPDSDRPGYDFVTQAECGWMSITGDPAGDPMKTGVALADVVAGKDAAISILAALVARATNARLRAEDRRLHVSLARSGVAALVNVAQNVLVSGDEARRWGNAHPNLVPYQLFPTANRPVVLAVGNDTQWVAACRALGLDALTRDAGLASNSGRVAQRERVVATIADRLAERPAEFWLGVLSAAGVPCGQVNSVGEALANVPASPLTGVESPVWGTIRLPPPKLDEHGALVRRHGWAAFAHL
jgi:crotonobetainyl-CoA:carnitine CoA-transferase CaiB-like acyl-CoA transferase